MPTDYGYLYQTGFRWAGDEAVPRTSIGKTGDLSKKLDRKQMRKRNIEH